MTDDQARVALKAGGVADATIAAIVSRKGDAHDAGETLVDQVGAGVDTAHPHNWGVKIGDEFIDGVTASLNGGSVAVERAVRKAMSALEAHSPPVVGPLRDIRSWGTSLADEYLGAAGDRLARGGLLDALTPGRVPALVGSAGSIGPSAAAPAPIVNVYAGVGDPVAIGREVSIALAAYQRASGTQTA